MYLKSFNDYKIKMSSCFVFNYVGRLAVRIQPYAKKYRLKIQGALIDYDNELCYFLKGHTQKYDFSDIWYAINAFNLTVKIILDNFNDSFKPSDFTPQSMVEDFDLDLMSHII